jgi:signal transduction histidine kinase
MTEGGKQTSQEVPVRSILNSVHVKYTIVPSLFLSFIAFISINSNAWIVSDVHHFYFEMFAVVLSTIVAFYCIARANSLQEKFSLFIGIGFVTIAVIDFLHATLSFSAAGNNTFLDYFIPQTWFAGRTFLGVMLVVAVIKYAGTRTNPISPSPSSSSMRHSTENLRNRRGDKSAATGYNQEEAPIMSSLSSSSRQQRQEPAIAADRHGNNHHHDEVLHRSLLFSLIMLAILAIGVVGISFFTIFPGMVTDFPVSRPYEIPAFVLFSIALFYFYKRKLYKSEDVFYRGILGALIIDIFGQIIMSYSSVNFHTAHNIAHILKDSGYFVIVISLAMSSIQHNKIAKERAEIIRLQYLKLKEKDRIKDEFINVAAHELRTPIQPILGMSQLLSSRVPTNNNSDNGDSDQREMLDVIIRNAKRLQRLTENILDVTKIESQSLVMKMETFDLCDIIINAIDDVTASSDYLKKQKSLRILYHPKHIILYADKNRLMQVVSNLLSNSIKFTTEGYVSITVEENKAINCANNNISSPTGITNDSNDEIVIRIQDTGQGITPEILPNLFSKFTSNHSSGGTGLGLFISKSIVEAHGGKIWASNNEDGEGRRNEGATFTFTLPITNNPRRQLSLSSPTFVNASAALSSSNNNNGGRTQ